MWREPIRRRNRQLLQEFVERSDGLLRAQEHMLDLLGAVVVLAEGLDLEALLERTIKSACELVGARYGALGIIGTDRRLSHFITFGISEEDAAVIGPPPTGHGVLGEMIREPKPLRLHDLTQHPLAVGFPPGHPAMGTFLGIPVLVRGKVFGNLYLTEKLGGGDFSEEDEDLVVAFAAAAGLAIQNAQSFDDSNLRRRWMEAAMEASDEVKAHDAFDLGNLEMIAEKARRVSASTVAVVASVGADGHVSCRCSVGAPSLTRGQEITGATLLHKLLDAGAPVASADADEIFDADVARKLGPVLLAAMGTEEGGRNRRILLLARSVGDRQYSQADIESSAGFTSRLALALDLVEANRMREEYALFVDRDRIARDLHDLVIQKLFAVGLNIQSLRRNANDPDSEQRIDVATTELDGCIRQLRDTIYALQRRDGGKELLSGSVLRIVQDAAQASGFVPQIELDGPVDDGISDDIREQLLSVLQESLSNAIKHSGSSQINIRLAVMENAVVLTVRDKGRGFDGSGTHGGLKNMNDRARFLGGSFTVDSTPGQGTNVTWSVPARA